MNKFKYIIIGAGSSGCALANRLSKDKNNQVLLIEAGPKDNSAKIKIPLSASSLFKDKKLGWGYESIKQSNLNNRCINSPRGKTLGGSSSTNGMVYIRGQAEDYNKFAQDGCIGWSFNDLLPYFRSIENNQTITDQYHGNFGDVWVDTFNYSLPISKKFINAVNEKGIKKTYDFNGSDQEGVGYYQVNIKDGRRFSSADAFLKDIKTRKNLKIINNAITSKIIIKNNQALGVEFERKNKISTVICNGEIILAAGAINSPQILNLSGIGNGNILRKYGINVIVDNKNVGEHLQDHLTVNVSFNVNQNTFYEELRGINLIKHLFNYMIKGKSIFSYSAADVGVFFKLNSSSKRPDFQIHFAPGAGEYHNDGTMNPISGITASVCHLRPQSRGSVKIASNNHNQAPLIDYNYLSVESDREYLLEGVKKTRDFFNALALADLAPKEILPGSQINTDEQLKEFIKETALSVYHPVGTCKMGVNNKAVVDPDLKVYGVKNLRVADASILPNIISGNTNAICNVIGVKCADMILNQ